jgi:hypothetical protein
VSLAILSLIIGSFSALFYTLETTNAAISRIERSENIDVVRRYLQNSLEGIRPHSILGADGTRTIRFQGAPSRVMFTAVATGDREIGGLYETEIWLDHKGRLLQLRRPLGWGQGMKAVPEILLEDLASLTFSYYPCPSGVHDSEGHRWANTSLLPFLISVMANFTRGEGRDWRKVSAFVPAAACNIEK